MRLSFASSILVSSTSSIATSNQKIRTFAASQALAGGRRETQKPRGNSKPKTTYAHTPSVLPLRTSSLPQTRETGYFTDLDHATIRKSPFSSIECNPSLRDADVGILCNGEDCLENSDSSLGGYCADHSPLKRNLEDEDVSFYITVNDVYSWCNVPYYEFWNCNCDGWDAVNLKGNITQCSYEYCSGCDGGICAKDSFWVYINETGRIWQECNDYGEWEVCLFGHVEYGATKRDYSYECSFEYRGTEHCCFFEPVKEGECGFRSCKDSDFPFEICQLMAACPADLDSDIPWATLAPSTAPSLSASPSTTPTRDPTRSPTSVPSDISTSPTKAKEKTVQFNPPSEYPAVMLLTKAPRTPQTQSPTVEPVPTRVPTAPRTKSPMGEPLPIPTKIPTIPRTKSPTDIPSPLPSKAPTATSTSRPTEEPSPLPTKAPIKPPTRPPRTSDPTVVPSAFPTKAPVKPPTSPPRETTLEPLAFRTPGKTPNPSVGPSDGLTFRIPGETQNPSLRPTKETISDNIFTVGREGDVRATDAQPTLRPVKKTDLELLAAQNIVDPQLSMGETAQIEDIDVPENAGDGLDENTPDSASRREMLGFLLLTGTSAFCALLL